MLTSAGTYGRTAEGRLRRKRMRENRIAKGMKIGNRVLAYFLMISFVFGMTAPLYWMAVGSLKPEGENLSYPPTLIPQTWTLEHYQRLFTATMFPSWFRNSAIVSIGTTVACVAISAMGAYTFTRFRYRFFGLFSRLILFAYMVPSILLLIPVFKIVWSLGLANSLFAVMLTNNAFLIPYGLWTLRSYFSGMPREIEEAALIDGCNRWQAFVKAVIPQALPGIIATALFAFHVAWNEYLFSSVLLWSSKRQTLSAGVATLLGEAPDSWGLLMAAGVMITLPVIILFSFLQSYLVAGWGGGAVKG